MNHIKRKVLLTKDLVPYDSNNDGNYDSLVISATTKSILVSLTTSYDDMGIFEVDDEEFIDIINIGSIFDDSIEGKDIPQPNDPINPDSSEWGSGEPLTGGGSAGQPYDYQYCGDTLSPNYQSIENIGAYFGVEGSDAQIISELTALNVTLVVTNSLCSDAGTSGVSADTEEQGGYFVAPPKTLWTTETAPGNSGTSNCGGSCKNNPGGLSDLGSLCKCGCPGGGAGAGQNGNDWTSAYWSSYENTAKNKAQNYCGSLGQIMIPDISPFNAHPDLQGNPTNYPNDGKAWVSVKHVETVTKTCCNDWISYGKDVWEIAVAAGITPCPNTPSAIRAQYICCGAGTGGGGMTTKYNHKFQFFCVSN